MGDRVENVLRSAIRSWERWYWASGRGAMWGVGVGVGVSYGVIMFPRNRVFWVCEPAPLLAGLSVGY